jgi:hypothetical protein
MMFHKVYGLLIGTDAAIPALPAWSGACDPVDVRVHLKSDTSPLFTYGSPAQAFYVSEQKDDNDQPLLRAGFLDDGNYLALFYSDGTRFAIECHGSEVFVDWPGPLTLEDTAPYLVGPVLGVVLRLRGMVPLHASAVAVDGHAVAIAGPAGAGKSTTAAAFAKCGYRVISDDVVALREEGAQFIVPPGYPRVNLWHESVQGLLGDGDALPRISPGWDKRFMALSTQTEFETEALPLAGIYLLQNRQSVLRVAVVEELVGTEAFVGLLGNTYMNHLPDRNKRSREFELLGRVVARVPVRQVRSAPDLLLLPNLCEAIAADVQRIIGKSAGLRRNELVQAGASAS